MKRLCLCGLKRPLRFFITAKNAEKEVSGCGGRSRLSLDITDAELYIEAVQKLKFQNNSIKHEARVQRIEYASNTVLVSTETQTTQEQEPPGSVIRATESFVQSVLAHLGIENWEVSILYCGNEYMRQLNRQYRGKDEPTDVLSFSPGAGGFFSPPSAKIIAGDIVISLDSLKKNCGEFGVPPDEELKRLLVHGILHLNGYDHERNLLNSYREDGDIKEEEEMLVVQERVLQFFRASVIIEAGDGSI
jgi:probable rRNA maturation factor